VTGVFVVFSVWSDGVFFVIFIVRRSRGFTRSKRLGKKRGAGDCAFAGQLSLAQTTTGSRPHGISKHNKNFLLGQTLFPAARRPRTISVPRRRSAGAFFMPPRGRWEGARHGTASLVRSGAVLGFLRAHYPPIAASDRRYAGLHAVAGMGLQRRGRSRRGPRRGHTAAQREEVTRNEHGSLGTQRVEP
jgi:hypothetical protein